MDTLDRTNFTGYETAFDRGAEELADSMFTGLSGGVRELLADPIVQALMAADGVDRPSLEDLLRRTAARLGTCERYAQRHC